MITDSCQYIYQYLGISYLRPYLDMLKMQFFICYCLLNKLSPRDTA